MYKLFLCLRYLRKRRIAFFTVAAVCLCVAMVLIVVSVMGGFLRMVTERSRGMLGDLVVENDYLQGFPYYQDFIDEVKSDPALRDRIHEATPVIVTYGVLRFPTDNATMPVEIRGLRLEETYRVNEFKKGLFYEHYYPGSTTLEPQREARYGMDEQRRIVLPADLEAARRRWQAGATPEEIHDAWRARTLRFALEAGDIPRQLDRRRIPDELKRAFEDVGHVLPDDASVTILPKRTGWRIDVGEDSYVIVQKEDRLAVLYSEYPGPGFYQRVPIDLQIESLAPVWYGDELPGIILGTDLVGKRLRTGEYDRYYPRGYVVQLTMVPVSHTGDVGDATGMPSRTFRYADDCRTGVYDIDSMAAYVDFALLQGVLDMDEFELFDENAEDEDKIVGTMPPRATQIQIKLNPGYDLIESRDLLQAKWNALAAARLTGLTSVAEIEAIEPLFRRVEVKTWLKKQERFISAVQKEKILVTVLFGVISLVAVFLVGSTFYMIVQQKTRDVGIVKSVGATSIGVAGIFLSYGAAVGVVGGALGVLIGTVFVHHINEVQEALIWLSPSLEIWNPEVYAFDRIPNTVEPVDVVVIYLVAVAASVIGSVVAAIRAAYVWPVEALRYE